MPQLHDSARCIEALAYEPIHSIWLQFSDSVPLPAPMLGLTGSPAQWLFDREKICGQRGLIGAVISASGEHLGIAQDQLVQRVQSDLQSQFGPLPSLDWHQVIAEKRATFSCAPGITRPQQRTTCANFFLAGDYTASDLVTGEYPATIESAVRSGARAAVMALGG